MSDARALPLEAWSRWHAVVMSGAALAAVYAAKPWPLAAAAIPSLVVLVWLCRGAYTPRGSFGPANCVTALRFALIASAPLLLHRANGWLYCAWVQLIFALDGIDGQVARRSGSASKFGAHFDMESDGVFVLVLGVELWQRGRVDAWIVFPGLLRYVYVLVVSVFPVRRSEPQPGNFGRRAFVLLIIGLSLALIVPGWPGTLAAALGTAVIAVSFARSFLWSYGVVPRLAR